MCFAASNKALELLPRNPNVVTVELHSLKETPILDLKNSGFLELLR